jgi:signal transduction histidine kinase
VQYPSESGSTSASAHPPGLTGAAAGVLGQPSSPVQADGPALGRLFVVRDITRESEAERMRGAFVATVSHELRSPLTAIVGYTDTLLSSGPWEAETQREFLEIVAQSATKLTGLVDNLLDAAKVEAGVLSLDREPVRLERIAQQVVAQRRPLAHNHTLRLEIEPDLPGSIPVQLMVETYRFPSAYF